LCGSSPVLKNIQRSVHTISRPAVTLIKGETPIAVYTSVEYESLKKMSDNGVFVHAVMSS